MADNVVLLRAKLRLKQTELAEKVGISRQTLMGIENKNAMAIIAESGG